MPLTPEQREKIIGEMKQIATALGLSDDQKQKAQQFLSTAYEKLQEYKQQNPDLAKEEMIRRVADTRTFLRQQLAILFSPDQLTKWDAEVERIKDFLFVKMSAAASA